MDIRAAVATGEESVVMRGDEKLTAFVELESVIFRCSNLTKKPAEFFPSCTTMEISAVTESALAFTRKQTNSTIPQC